MQHRAFVAGSTGYTGNAVVRALRNHGLQVVAHVRPDTRRAEEWEARFAACGAMVDRTPWTEAAMTARMAELQPTLVFALLGTTRARARAARRSGGNADYHVVDYGLTAILLHAVKAAAPGARFVYLSSLGARAGVANTYLAVRARLERELERSGIDYVIVRPSFITGPDREERRRTERASAALLDGLLRVASALGARRLARRYRSMRASELADALVARALDSAASGRVFEPDDLR